jgi:hypothetical protein
MTNILGVGLCNIADPTCLWEAKLVAWLLHLQALGSTSSSSSSSSSSSLWDAYCRALPAAEDTLSFFCYSPEQAEQLQLSTWKVCSFCIHTSIECKRLLCKQQAAKMIFSCVVQLHFAADLQA